MQILQSICWTDLSEISEEESYSGHLCSLFIGERWTEDQRVNECWIGSVFSWEIYRYPVVFSSRTQIPVLVFSSAVHKKSNKTTKTLKDPEAHELDFILLPWCGYFLGPRELHPLGFDPGPFHYCGVKSSRSLVWRPELAAAVNACCQDY